MKTSVDFQPTNIVGCAQSVFANTFAFIQQNWRSLGARDQIIDKIFGCPI